MAGRRQNKKGEGSRPQAAKRGSTARGHGRHHRTGDGAPRAIASGRQRTEKGTRERGWRRFDDERIEKAAASERLQVGASKETLEDVQDAQAYGAKLEGLAAAGIVLEVRRGSFLVELTRPPELPAGAAPCPGVLRAEPRGLMQHFDLGLSSLVAAGDEVDLIVPPVIGNDEEYVAVLTQVRPRRTEFRRLHPSGRAIQTLATNVDQVAIVASAAEPPFRPGFVDRVLCCASACALPARLVLNKIDLGVDESDRELLDVYRGLGVDVFLTSAMTFEGLEGLRAALLGKRTVLCGHSGVGKSSLLGALAPNLAEEIRVGEVSGTTSKGTHTTTHAKLYRLGAFEVIDTPGVREFTPADTDRRNLWGWFPEIAARQGHCGFSDCTHTVEEKCAVLQAVEAGAIHPRRHESYVRIFKTLPG
ncbi:MAG: ribosome small subunit-dependent GTPase A [Planctomycetota bacterium]|nr:ribosome small subunit-dependent GTPase A [Planctomycetota bacterium]